MSAYYNEFKPEAAQMLRQLIKEGTGKTDAEKLVTALRERVLKMEVEAKQKSIGKV